MAPTPPNARNRAGGAVAVLGHGVRENGGPDMAPTPPDVRRAPAEPWRASMPLAVLVPAALLTPVRPIPRAPSPAAPRLPRVGYLGYTSPAGAPPDKGPVRP